jgi:hypothetical protein
MVHRDYRFLERLCDKVSEHSSVTELQVEEMKMTWNDDWEIVNALKVLIDCY